MRLSSTVAGLGVPSTDGTMGILRVGSGATAEDVLLFWNDTQKAWVSRPRYSMRQVDVIGMQRDGAIGNWVYPTSNDTGFSGDSGFGFQIHAVPNALNFWNAGLRLQERLSGCLRPTDGNTGQMALNWYELDPGDGFLTPVPTNLGVPLYTKNDSLVYNFVTSGWQNSPVATPTKAAWYPELYAKDSILQFRNFTAEYRLAGGTVGATGGSDDSSSPPPVVASLYSWHVADELPIANGAAVANWTDQSGWSRNLTQTTGANQPTLVTSSLNGHSVVRFDGTNDFLQTTTGSVAQPLTYFIVLKQYGGGPASQVWFEGGGGNKPLLYRADGTNAIHAWAGGTETGYSVSGGWPMSHRCISVVWNGASSSIWENKTSKATGDFGSNGLGGLTLGAAWDGTLPAQIDVAEVLIYFQAMNNTDRNSVVDYLNAKYALF